MFRFTFRLLVIGLLAACSGEKQTVTQETTFSKGRIAQSQAFLQSAGKRAKQQAKSLAKQGFYTDPLGLPMDAQLHKAYVFESEVDESGQSRFIVEKATVVARTKSSGKQHALETAKLTIAGYLQSHIAGLVKSDLSNHQLSEEEAESINKMVSSYENWIVNNLGSVEPLAILYRDLKGDKVEVQVSIAFDLSQNLEQVRSKTLSKLEEDTDVSREKLESVFSPERFNEMETNQLN